METLTAEQEWIEGAEARLAAAELAECAEYDARVAAQLLGIRAGYTAEERETVAAYEMLLYG